MPLAELAMKRRLPSMSDAMLLDAFAKLVGEMTEIP